MASTCAGSEVEGGRADRTPGTGPGEGGTAQLSAPGPPWENVPANLNSSLASHLFNAI